MATEIEKAQTTLAPEGSEEPMVALALGGDTAAGAAVVTVNGIVVGEADPVSFRIADQHLPYEVTVAIIRQLGRVNRWSRWALADALIFAEHVYGDRYAQAASVTGLAPDTVKNLVYTAANVPRSRRVPELGISIHAEVAPLEPAEQRKWLKKALEEDWGRDTLRAELRRAREIAEENGGAVEPPDGKPRPGEMMTRAEQVAEAAARVWREAQPDGEHFRVPREAMATLAAALGEGE